MSAPVVSLAACRRHTARLLGLAVVILAILLTFFRPSGRLPELPAASLSGGAYWLATAGGKILNFGGAAAFDPVPSTSIVAVAGTPSGGGLWLVGRDGGVFSRGDAGFYGSLGALKLNQPIVGIAGTPSGQGYWLVSSDGGLFAFGDAGFYGSLGALKLNKPIVGMAATASGLGYWMVASDGGMFAFGDAAFLGSMGGTPLNRPVVGMAAAQGGAGYWLVASDGGTFSFGNAGFHGSTGALTLASPIVGIASTAAADGYWMVAQDGGVFAFDAPFLGSGTTRTGAATASVSGEVFVGMAVADAQPDARSGSVSTAEDASVNIDVLANDKYLTDDPVTVKIVTSPAHGTVVVKSDLTVTYTPDANFTGTDSFKYEVKDKDGDKDTASVNITVSAVNDSPKISNIADREVDEDGSTGSIAFTVSDVDNSDGGLTVTATSSNGTLVPAGGITLGGSGSNRTVTVTPAANASGSAVISVKVSDGSANTTDTFNLTVNPVDDAPAATDDNASTNEDSALVGIDVLANDAGLGDGGLGITFSNEVGGTASVGTGNSVTFTPAADFNGAASFDYTVTDGDSDADTGHVTVTVNSVDDLPVATDENGGTTNEDSALVGIDVLANDAGLGDGGLGITFSNEVGGTASLVGNLVTFTPAADFNGAASFDYTVTDGDSDADTGHVTVTVNSVDDVPVATDESGGSTNEDTPLVGIDVLANDTGLGDGGLGITFSNEVGGTASVGTGNSVTFTPAADFNGAASFDYTVTDGDADADTGHVTVTVNAVNDAPVFGVGGDVGSGNEEALISGTVSASDPDSGDTLAFSIEVGGEASDGTASVNASTGAWSYTGDLDFAGSDSFTITVSDGNGGSDTIVVNVTVTNVNDAPVIDLLLSDDGLIAVATVPTPGTIVATDVDAGTTLTYSIEVGDEPLNGTAIINSTTGIYTYTGDPGFSTDSFVVTVTDGNGGSTTVTVNITEL